MNGNSTELQVEALETPRAAGVKGATRRTAVRPHSRHDIKTQTGQVRVEPQVSPLWTQGLKAQSCVGMEEPRAHSQSRERKHNENPAQGSL